MFCITNTKYKNTLGIRKPISYLRVILYLKSFFFIKILSTTFETIVVIEVLFEYKINFSFQLLLVILYTFRVKFYINGSIKMVLDMLIGDISTDYKCISVFYYKKMCIRNS